jgi:predicted RNA-binding protein Jag
MPWPVLIRVAPWILVLVSMVPLLFYKIEVESLTLEIDSAKAASSLAAEQRQAVIAVNHGMHETIIELQNEIEASRQLNEWLNEFTGAMDAKLASAIDDIERSTDGKSQSSSSCDYNFSGDVSQRMLDVYTKPSDSLQD